MKVLADQAVWAVCGRAAAVVDMSLATEIKSENRMPRRRQTLTVEVMPLVGGKLLLPKIRLSRYIAPKDEANDGKGSSSSSSMPRLEPFLPGQVFNSSRFVQIHVLSSGSQSAGVTSATRGGERASMTFQTLNSRALMTAGAGAAGAGPVSLP